MIRSGTKASSASSGFGSWHRPFNAYTSRVARQALSSQIHDAALECTKCRRMLPASQFHKDRSRTNGLKPYCKECKRHYDRELRQRRRIANANRTYVSDARLRCTRCQQLLPASGFAKNLMQPKGLQSWCKPCDNEAMKLRAQKYKASNEANSIKLAFMKPADWELDEALALNSTAEMNEALSRFGMKWCPSCLEAKLYIDFHKNRQKKWGLECHCKRCLLEQQRGRRTTKRREHMPVDSSITSRTSWSESLAVGSWARYVP